MQAVPLVREHQCAFLYHKVIVTVRREQTLALRQRSALQESIGLATTLGYVLRYRYARKHAAILLLLRLLLEELLVDLRLLVALGGAVVLVDVAGQRRMDASELVAEFDTLVA